MHKRSSQGRYRQGAKGWTTGALLWLAACGSAQQATESDASSGEGRAPLTDGGTGRDTGTKPRDGSVATGQDATATVEVGPPGTPTVSSWLGTNVDVDLPLVDVATLLTAFNTPAAKLDPDGYPVAGAVGTSSSDIGFQLPSGNYNISYVGTGQLAVSGIGALVGTWRTDGSEHRAQVKITSTPGNFGQFLTLVITNMPGQTVSGIHLYLPGTGYDPKDPLNPPFVATLAPFRAMRFMGWLATNNSKLADWSARPVPTHFGASPDGMPLELVADLINETGKDGWINVPEHATGDFITNMASFMASHLDFDRIATARTLAGFKTPFQLIVENSNETWNQGFSCYATFLAAATKDPALYTGVYEGTAGPTWMSGNSDLMKVAQYEADRLVSIGKVFGSAFAAVGHADAIAPVLSGWAIGAAYSDQGLAFIKANHGDPSKYVTYVALAPYFSTLDDSTTGSLDTLFPALETAIDGTDTVFQDFEALGKEYGVSIAAYEGGQGMTGTTNQTIKHLAQFDVRMYSTYVDYLTFWKQHFGESLFMHFDLAGIPGLPESIYQYGFWGSLTGVSQDRSTCGDNLPNLNGNEMIQAVTQYCPKYRALRERVPQ